jgi:apolipoprotein D and lipocalin family protein
MIAARIKPLALIAVLPGCMPTAEPTGFAAGTIPLRNPTAPFASQVNVDPTKLAGGWRISQIAGTNWPVAGQEVAISVSGADGYLTLSGAIDCADGTPNCQAAVEMPRIADGRWRAKDGAGTISGEIWLLWTDVGRRTVVFGSPEGDVVWIMDRNLPIPTDRNAAAQDILKWFGYDLARLEGEE